MTGIPDAVVTSVIEALKYESVTWVTLSTFTFSTLGPEKSKSILPSPLTSKAGEIEACGEKRRPFVVSGISVRHDVFRQVMLVKSCNEMKRSGPKVMEAPEPAILTRLPWSMTMGRPVLTSRLVTSSMMACCNGDKAAIASVKPWKESTGKICGVMGEAVGCLDGEALGEVGEVVGLESLGEDEGE